MLVRLASVSPDHAGLATFYLSRLLPRAGARCVEIATS
jgi:hypothetical protein